MPFIPDSQYRPPVGFGNPHVQTVYPTLFRRVEGVSYQRERIDTVDGDFLDLDFSPIGTRRLAIVLHGLEGDSSRSYMKGMVKAVNRGGWDALAVNFRGCSGEPNRKLRLYHSGDTADLARVVDHVLSTGRYDELALIGFSLGGNVILKYLGEQGKQTPPAIRRAATFSVPCDLSACSVEIGRLRNRLYLKRFLVMLRVKIKAKMALRPGEIDDRDWEKMKSLKDFDNRYTAPLHGFTDAEDYYVRASSKPFLESISVPTLIVNAADDPFLSETCFPRREAESNGNLFLEIPKHGGHVGFVSFNVLGEFWSEARAASFLSCR